MSKRRWTWAAATAALVSVVAWAGTNGLYPKVLPLHSRAPLVYSIVGVYYAIAGTVFVTAAALSAAQYRSTRDPRRLFLALGTGAVGLQLLLFQGLWPLLDLGEGPTTLARIGIQVRRTAVPDHAALVGWIVGGACLLGGIRWRERRGLHPVPPIPIVTLVVMALVLADVALALFPPSPLTRAGTGVIASRLGPLGVALGIVATLILGTQAVREWIEAGRNTAHALTACGMTFAALAIVGVLGQDAGSVGGLVSRSAWGWATYLPIASAVLLFAGLLSTHGEESSRMRRESDRAAEITGGRAEIASMVAHEIRGPVTTIRGLAQTSERHYDRLPESDRREFLRLIEGESDRLLHIADQTSTALKVDARTLTYSMEPNDLADVVGAAIGQAATGTHPIETELEVGTRVVIDSVRFGEVVRQLIENAASFSPPDAPITVRAYRDGSAAVVDVIDRGPGIPPERRELAFTKFPGFRPSGYEEAPGTGLGLFICRAHVREHGGNIEVDDGPDGGTMLRITLPEREEG